MFPSSIFPNEQLLSYQAPQQIGSCFPLTLSSKQSEPPCPLCSTPSRRVHSRYTRLVADLPVAGYRVMLELQVKKFFKASPDHCDKFGCKRWIFCERLPEVVQPYGRRSIRLVEALKHLGLLVSAEVSRSIAERFGISASPDSFLRTARGCDAPSDDIVVRKVGIDDWAKRKGHNYATIIVDLERGCPVELLPDREASTLQEWLEAQPEIELIARDRSTAYAEACGSGAPQAEQIADLWHLLRNLFEALERHLSGQYKTLNATLKQAALNQEAPASSPLDASVSPLSKQRESSSSRQRASRRQRRQERFEEVKRLDEQGWSKRQIAKELGLHRVTLRKYLAADELPGHGNAGRRRQSLLDPFKDYLQQRHTGGCHNAARLFRELRARLFRRPHYRQRLSPRAQPRDAKPSNSEHSNHSQAPGSQDLGLVAAL